MERLNYNYVVGGTTEVGTYPPGANGLYDMAGNVVEWTNSQYQSYPYNAADGRENTDNGASRSLRGGAWPDSGNSVRCAVRGRFDPDYGNYNVGFRVVAP